MILREIHGLRPSDDRALEGPILLGEMTEKPSYEQRSNRKNHFYECGIYVCLNSRQYIFSGCHF